MSTLAIHLFGRFRIQHGNAEDLPIDAAKAQELLAYLLLNRRRACRREALADLLWPDSSLVQARKYFRQTLWQLQAALGEHAAGEPSQEVLLVDQEWLRINPAADLWVDVASLESALELSRGGSGQDLTPSQADELRAGARVYLGELLEAWTHEWCVYERERLAIGHLQLLDKLMDFCEAHRAYEEAVEYGGEILRTDPVRERTHRNLMRLHYLAGDRAQALRQFGRCREALRNELDVEPSARTRAVYQQVLADEIVPSSATDAAMNVAGLRSLLEVLNSHIQSALEQLDRLAGSRA
jgi:DNA-binding SARP family transcriptional activator